MFAKNIIALSKDYGGGNVRERPLKEIWEARSALTLLGRRRVDDLRGACRTCYHAEDCLGACT